MMLKNGLRPDRHLASVITLILLSSLLLFCFGNLPPLRAQTTTQPVVAIHDSELTRTLELMPAVSPTPAGSGTTGFQWWPADWHYFVMPESVQEALRSDGTA